MEINSTNPWAWINGQGKEYRPVSTIIIISIAILIILSQGFILPQSQNFDQSLRHVELIEEHDGNVYREQQNDQFT